RFGTGSVNTGRKGAWQGWLTYFVAISLGITVSRWLIACRILWPDAVVKTAWCLLAVGLIIRWYFVIEHQRDWVGILLIVLALSLSTLNWASALIIFIPCLAITGWRMRMTAKVPAEKTQAGENVVGDVWR